MSRAWDWFNQSGNLFTLSDAALSFELGTGAVCFYPPIAAMLFRTSPFV